MNLDAEEAYKEASYLTHELVSKLFELAEKRPDLLQPYLAVVARSMGIRIPDEIVQSIQATLNDEEYLDFYDTIYDPLFRVVEPAVAASTEVLEIPPTKRYFAPWGESWTE